MLQHDFHGTVTPHHDSHLPWFPPRHDSHLFGLTLFLAGTGIFGGNSHQTYTSPLDVPPNINITTDPSCHSTFGPRSIRAIKSTIQQHSPTGTGRQAACLATPSSPSRHSTSVSASALDRHHSSVSTRASCASTCQGTQRAEAG